MKNIILIIFIIFSINIFSKEQIKWFVTNYPPAFIIEDNNFNGFEVNTLNNLIKNLKNYNITYYQTSLSRALEDMKNKKNVCALYLFKTPEREKNLYYSLPYRVTFSNGIIIKKSEKNKFKDFFDKNNKIKLKSLLKDKTLTLGINKRISYGKEIDDIIQKYINNPNIFLLTRENYIENLLKLLSLNRIDYFIGYSESIKYLSKKLNTKDEFIYIPISELNKDYFLLYVVAPKNDFGKKVINDVNEIILKTNFVKDAANYYKKWLNKDSQVEFEKMFNNFFNKYFNKK